MHTIKEMESQPGQREPAASTGL